MQDAVIANMQKNTMHLNEHFYVAAIKSTWKYRYKDTVSELSYSEHRTSVQTLNLKRY